MGFLNSSGTKVERNRLFVTNNEGSTLPPGTPVYIKSRSNDEILIGMSDSDLEETMPAIGITTRSMKVGESADILLGGFVDEIELGGLTAATVGQTLYVSETGTLTNVEPGGTVQSIGTILKVNAAGDTATEALIAFGGAGAGGGGDLPTEKVYMTVYALNNIPSQYFCSVTTDINGNHYSADGYPYVETAETMLGANHTLTLTGFNDTGETVPSGTTFEMLVSGPVITKTAGNVSPYGGLKWGDSLFYYVDFAGYIVDGYDQGLPPVAIALEDYGETGVGTNKIRCYVNPPTQYYQYPDRTKWDASTRIRVRPGAAIADGSLLVSTNGASADEPAVRQYDPSAGDVWADVIGLAPYAASSADFLMPIAGEVGITPVISGGLGLKVYSDVTNPHLLTTVNTSGNFVGIISTDNGDGTYTVLFTPAASEPSSTDLDLITRGTAYSATGDHEGTVLSIGSTALTAGTVYMWDGTQWNTANAGAVATADGLMGVATATATGPDVLVSGIIYMSATGSAGDPLYLDTTTGALSATAPSASTEVVRVMGYKLDANRVYFDPSNDWLEIV